MRKNFYTISILLLLVTQLVAQSPTFTRQDTLRGFITPERAWWDLTYYHLQIKVDIANKPIKGQNVIHYTVLVEGNSMQIDLQPPLKITKSGARQGGAFF